MYLTTGTFMELLVSQNLPFPETHHIHVAYSLPYNTIHIFCQLCTHLVRSFLLLLVPHRYSEWEGPSGSSNWLQACNQSANCYQHFFIYWRMRPFFVTLMCEYIWLATMVLPVLPQTSAYLTQYWLVNNLSFNRRMDRLFQQKPTKNEAVTICLSNNFSIIMRSIRNCIITYFYVA